MNQKQIGKDIQSFLDWAGDDARYEVADESLTEDIENRVDFLDRTTMEVFHALVDDFSGSRVGNMGEYLARIERMVKEYE